MAITTGTKSGKGTKGDKPKGKTGKVTKPVHPGGGKAKSENTSRVSHAPKAGTVKGSDGRKHSVGRFRTVVEKR